MNFGRRPSIARARRSSSRTSVRIPSRSMATPWYVGRYVARAVKIPRYVGWVTTTTSPSSRRIRPRSSIACCAPWVTMTRATSAGMPRPFIRAAKASRSFRSPCVGPYWKAAPPSSWSNASKMTRRSSSGNESGLGRPPAKLIMRGFCAYLSSSRTSEAFIHFVRSAKSVSMEDGIGIAVRMRVLFRESAAYAVTLTRDDTCGRPAGFPLWTSSGAQTREESTRASHVCVVLRAESIGRAQEILLEPRAVVRRDREERGEGERDRMEEHEAQTHRHRDVRGVDGMAHPAERSSLDEAMSHLDADLRRHESPEGPSCPHDEDAACGPHREPREL